MSISFDCQNPWDKWIPIGEISFEKLKKTHPTMQNGDFILEQKTTHPFRFWAFYKPATAENYALYSLGFFGDSESSFYHEKKISSPIIIKSDFIFHNQKDVNKFVEEIFQNCHF